MKKPTPNPNAKKAKLIQLIHIGKSKLNLDDGTYRDMLTNLTGKNSTKAMTQPELNKVLAHLRKNGFTTTAPTSKKQQAGRLRQADSDQAKLIRHLWLTLHEKGAVKNPSELALSAYVKRQTGIDYLGWLPTDKASQVIESLKKWRQRTEKQQAN